MFGHGWDTIRIVIWVKIRFCLFSVVKTTVPSNPTLLMVQLLVNPVQIWRFFHIYLIDLSRSLSQFSLPDAIFMDLGHVAGIPTLLSVLKRFIMSALVCQVVHPPSIDLVVVRGGTMYCGLSSTWQAQGVITLVHILTGAATSVSVIMVILWS